MKRQEIYQQGKPRKFFDQIRDVMRVKHYSIRTERTYIGWVKWFILFHDIRRSRDMGEPEVESFLTLLAVDKNVAKSIQNEALNASSHLGSNEAMLLMFVGYLSKIRCFQASRHHFQS